MSIREWATYFNGVGPDGEEVRVSKGVGRVTAMDPSKAGHTIKVSISTAKLKYPLHGHLNVSDTALVNKAEEAMNNGTPVRFRIEQRRKAGVDLTTPIDELRGTNLPSKSESQELANKNTVLIFTAVGDADENTPLLESSEARTNVANDPTNVAGDHRKAEPLNKPTAPTVRNTPQGGSPHRNSALETLAAVSRDAGLPQGTIATLSAQALLEGATPEQVAAAVYTNNSSRNRSYNTPNPNATGVFADESVAWEEYNTDGRLNMGGFGVSGAVDFQNLIIQKLYGENTADNTRHTIDYNTVNTLTRALLYVADQTQTALYGQGFHPNRMKTSHTVARRIVKSTVQEILPLPTTPETKGVLNLWVQELLEHTTMRAQVLRRTYLNQSEPPAGALTPNMLPDPTGEQVDQTLIQQFRALWEKEMEEASEEVSNPQNLAPLLGYTVGVRSIQQVDKGVMVHMLSWYENHPGLLRATVEYLAK